MTFRTGRSCQPRKQQLQIVVDLSHRPHRRTRRLDRIRLLNGNGRRNPPNVVNQRLVHALEKLAHIRRKCLNIPALAFGINRVESERALARPARARDHSDFSQRNIDVNALQIMLPGTTDFDHRLGPGRSGRYEGRRFGQLGGRGRLGRRGGHFRRVWRVWPKGCRR